MTVLQVRRSCFVQSRLEVSLAPCCSKLAAGWASTNTASGESADWADAKVTCLLATCSLPTEPGEVGATRPAKGGPALR